MPNIKSLESKLLQLRDKFVEALPQRIDRRRAEIIGRERREFGVGRRNGNGRSKALGSHR